MKSAKENKSPVIIGGSGGSGTRVVAEILKQSGVYIGQDLNKSNDNLLFSYLFKHPNRFAKELNKNDSRLNEIFNLHERLFLGNCPNKIQHLKILWQARNVQLIKPKNRRYRKWVLQRMLKIIQSKSVKPSLWGWKEPHTGFFLDAIQSYYPFSKYILVMRHGLDMSYTKTVEQLQYWSGCFEIDPNDLSPRNKFEYWYQYNKHIIVRANKLFEDRFLSTKMEDLCLKKESSINTLLDFVGIEVEKIPENILRIPKIPKTYQRYLNHSMEWINDEVRSKLYELGYSMDT